MAAPPLLAHEMSSETPAIINQFFLVSSIRKNEQHPGVLFFFSVKWTPLRLGIFYLAPFVRLFHFSKRASPTCPGAGIPNYTPSPWSAFFARANRIVRALVLIRACPTWSIPKEVRPSFFNLMSLLIFDMVSPHPSPPPPPTPLPSNSVPGHLTIRCLNPLFFPD